MKNGLFSKLKIRIFFCDIILLLLIIAISVIISKISPARVYDLMTIIGFIFVIAGLLLVPNRERNRSGNSGISLLQIWSDNKITPEDKVDHNNTNFFTTGKFNIIMIGVTVIILSIIASYLY